MAAPQVFSPGTRDLFLLELAKDGIIGNACRAVGISRSTVQTYRDSDPAFDAAVRDAIEDGTDVLETHAVQRATLGTESDVFHKDQVVGTKITYSDTLLALLLTRRRYTEKIESKIDANVNTRNLTQEQKAAAIAAILEKARKRKLQDEANEFI